VVRQSKTYIYLLTDVDRVIVRQLRDGYNVLQFSVQYEALINSRWRKITRYDNAHDSEPHRHVYYPFDKEEYRHPMSSNDNNDAFTEAQMSIKKNFMAMKESYILIMYRKV
jgi:hypothetical protein